MNANNSSVSSGSLLVAEPFLGDGNFVRSVVLVCEHSAAGTFGLVLNQATDLQLGDVIDDIYADLPLFVGGPVQQNTLHYLHRRPDLIEGSIRVEPDLYWSGDFEQVKQAINIGTLTGDDIRFFLGYSGWDGGQLEYEIELRSWIISRTTSDFLFNTPTDDFWREVLEQMGGLYGAIALYPTDPGLN